MADASKVRSAYVSGLQSIAQTIIDACSKMDELSALYLGAGLSGTFQDAELLADQTAQHMTAADVGTYTTNLNTIRSAITDPILQNLAKAVGRPV